MVRPCASLERDRGSQLRPNERPMLSLRLRRLVSATACAHVRLLGPCFKTGRVDDRPTAPPNDAPPETETSCPRPTADDRPAPSFDEGNGKPGGERPMSRARASARTWVRIRGQDSPGRPCALHVRPGSAATRRQRAGFLTTGSCPRCLRNPTGRRPQISKRKSFFPGGRGDPRAGTEMRPATTESERRASPWKDLPWRRPTATDRVESAPPGLRVSTRLPLDGFTYS